jgi:ABC-type Mn2+/Zn2+ transport system ATPase subunit
VTVERILTLEQVAVGYGRQTVLTGLDLVLRRGSFTALLGPNGSGKTTLLKTILGLLPALGGRVTLHPLAGREPVLGYVPQQKGLDSIFPLSSFEVVLMGGYGRVKPGRRVCEAERDWAAQCLEQTGVAAAARTLFSRLSGGQKQRVLIARALASRPDILLLDEPTAGIDPGAVELILDLLGRLHGQGMTILLVSHDLQAVRRQAKQACWLSGGRMVQGTVEELLSPERIERLLELKWA